MNKAIAGLIGLLVVTGAIIVLSYQFSVRTHREVVEHKLPVPDIPGAEFYDISMAESEKGKAFMKYMRKQTRRLEDGAFNIEVTLNDPKYFRLLAVAEARPGENLKQLFKMYKKRYRFEDKIIFTVMMYSPTGNLFNYSIDRFTVLRSGKKEYKPEKWIESNRSTSHHRRGILIFTRLSNMEDIKLVFKDPSGYGKDRVLGWTHSFNNGKKIKVGDASPIVFMISRSKFDAYLLDKACQAGA